MINSNLFLPRNPKFGLKIGLAGNFVFHLLSLHSSPLLKFALESLLHLSYQLTFILKVMQKTIECSQSSFCESSFMSLISWSESFAFSGLKHLEREILVGHQKMLPILLPVFSRKVAASKITTWYVHYLSIHHDLFSTFSVMLLLIKCFIWWFTPSTMLKLQIINFIIIEVIISSSTSSS